VAYRRRHGCRLFIFALPTILYGPHDNFDLDSLHVVPALICNFHEAKQRGDVVVAVWRTGTPRREFLHVDDLADARSHLMDHSHEEQTMNVSPAEETTIRHLVEMIGDIIYSQARREFDASQPDGTPRKLLDSSQLNVLGWRHRISLHAGLQETYDWHVTWRKSAS
jgi:GDP-L-fucose synthase